MSTETSSNNLSNLKYYSSAELATYHHYLSTAVLESLSEEESIGDIFGIGEDSFVNELFPFSVCFYVACEAAYKQEEEPRGVILY